MTQDYRTSTKPSARLDLLYLIPALFEMTQAHGRFSYFVDVIVDLLDHMCPDAHPVWTQYSQLIRDLQRTDLSESQALLLNHKMLYISTHHTFESNPFVPIWSESPYYRLT